MSTQVDVSSPAMHPLLPAIASINQMWGELFVALLGQWGRAQQEMGARLLMPVMLNSAPPAVAEDTPPAAADDDGDDGAPAEEVRDDTSDDIAAEIQREVAEEAQQVEEVPLTDAPGDHAGDVHPEPAPSPV